MSGFLFDKEEVAGFAKAMLTLYKNSALRAEMGERNAERAKTFSLKMTVDAMQEIY